MALTVQAPVAGVLPIKGALAFVNDSDLTVNSPTAGALPIIGAYVVGTIIAGAFVPLTVS